jgi:predicted deacylase
MKGSGFKRTETLEFRYSRNQEPIRFPVGTIEGDREGPTLVVLGGMHGSEFCGIQAAIELFNVTRPVDLRGTLVVGMIYNMPAFLNHAGFVVPQDNRNPMSTFPGRVDGSFGEVMAYHFERHILSKADYFVELHGGDIPEALAAFVVSLKTGNAEVDSTMEKMAKAYNVPLVIERTIKEDGKPGAAYRKAALRGIPSILAESGQQGILDADGTKVHLTGLRNVMNTLGMIDGVTIDTADRIVLESHGSIRCDRVGMWYPFVRLNQIVSKDEVVGEIRGYFGEILEEIKSPIDGLVNVVRTSPSVSLGQALIELHTVKEPGKVGGMIK